MRDAASERASRKLLIQLMAFLASRATLLGVTLLAARIAGVEEYGSFALALVIFQAGLLLRDAGLGHALIVLRQESLDLTWPAFIGTVVLGSAFALSMGLLGEPTAAVLGLPQSADQLRILALAFGIGSLGVASNASLEQQLRFNARAVIDIAAFGMLGIVSIILLLGGVGVDALAWGYVAHATVQSAAALALSPPWSNRVRGMPGIGRLFRYGGVLWIGALLAYLSTNADNAILGRLGGAAALGAYALSYTVGNTVTISLSQVLNRVALPYYARSAGDRGAIGSAVRSVVPLSVAAGMVPALIVIAVAPEIRSVVIGDKFSFIPLIILAAYGVVRSLGMSLGTVLNATRRASVATVGSAINVAVMLLLIVPAHAVAGIVGVAAAVLAAMALSTALLANSIAEVRGAAGFLVLPALAVGALSLLVAAPPEPIPLAIRVGAGLGLAAVFVVRALALLRGDFWRAAGGTAG